MLIQANGITPLHISQDIMTGPKDESSLLGTDCDFSPDDLAVEECVEELRIIFHFILLIKIRTACQTSAQALVSVHQAIHPGNSGHCY
jgi:hypothetical protein